MPQSERAGERKVGGGRQGEKQLVLALFLSPPLSQAHHRHRSHRNHAEEERGGTSAQSAKKRKNLEVGHALGGADDGQQVVAKGVGDVLGEVGVGALSRHEGLDPEAEDGDCFCEGVGLCAVEVSASFFNEKKKTSTPPPLSQRLFFQKNISYPWRGGRS